VQGGSAYVVRIVGDKIADLFVAPSLRQGLDIQAVEALEREAESRRHLPVWMKDLVEQSEENLRILLYTITQSCHGVMDLDRLCDTVKQQKWRIDTIFANPSIQRRRKLIGQIYTYRGV
jgi:hypothetical protein